MITFKNLIYSALVVVIGLFIYGYVYADLTPIPECDDREVVKNNLPVMISRYAQSEGYDVRAEYIRILDPKEVTYDTKRGYRECSATIKLQRKAGVMTDKITYSFTGIGDNSRYYHLNIKFDQ